MIALTMLIAWTVFAAWLLIRGWRGRIDLSGPTCAKCKYDLRLLDPAGPRACPECGVDLMDRKRVHYGRTRRRPILLMVGVVLLAAPFILNQFRLLGVAAHLDISRFKPTSWLIRDLGSTAGTPNTWNQLEARLAQNKLSAEEVTAAIDQLIAHLNANPKTRGTPLHWQQQFLSAAETAGLVTPEAQQKLMQAYYQDPPEANVPSALIVGEPLNVAFNIHPWDLPGFQRFTALRRVLLDGQRELKVQDRFQDHGEMPSSAHGMMHFNLNVEADPGPHQLTFEMDMGVIPEAEAQKFVSDPGPAEGWPAPALLSRQTVTVPINIITAQEQVRVAPKLIADPALAEEIRQAIEVKAVRISNAPPGEQTTLSLDYRIRRKTPMPVGFDIYVKVNGEEKQVGSCHASGGGHGSSSARSSITIPPAEITTAEVIFRTATNVDQLNLDEIWDGEIVYKDVPLAREEPAARGSGRRR